MARKSILVVDDEKPQRDILQEILTSAGYDVTSAASGEAAMKFAKERSFDLAELQALKSARAVQLFAELEEVERRHRFKHVDLVIKQLPDLNDAPQPMHDHIEVWSVIIRGGLAQHFTAGAELVQDLFEPKLVGLVDDDEEHLIVRVEFSFDETQRRLQAKELVDGEITAVIGGCLRAIERALHCETVVKAVTSDK